MNNDVSITEQADLDALIAAVKAGQAIRAPDGTRYNWISTRPSADALRNAKHHATRRSGVVACAVCWLAYSAKAAGASVREHGYCPNCAPFMEGRTEGVLSYRMPTREEALAVPESDRLPMEHHVTRSR